MRIAEVSKKYDISADTLRYYERIGLLEHVRRNESGIRDYSEADCARIQFIKFMAESLFLHEYFPADRKAVIFCLIRYECEPHFHPPL